MSRTLWMSLVFGASLYCCLFYVQKGESKIFDEPQRSVSTPHKKIIAQSFKEVSCAKETIKLKIKPTCFYNSKDKNWFSQALNPILSMEAEVPSVNVEKNKKRQLPMFFAAMGFSNLSAKPQTVLPLVFHDLNAEPLFSSKFPKEITVDYVENNLARVLNEEPGGWAKASVALLICDDSNQDGQCANETQEKILFNSGSFPICHLPAVLPECE